MIPATAIPVALAAALPLSVAHPRAHSPRIWSEDGVRKVPGIHRVGPEERATRDRVGREESLKLEQKARARRAHAKDALPSVPSTTWVNLGPTGAPAEFNGLQIAGVDSGRPTNIVVDPRDANVVYVAAAGGGVWKTFDFLSDAGPTWMPTLDTGPNLSIGALALDPAHPDTLFAGEGDFNAMSGDTIQKSTDGGGTWGPAVALTGTYSSGVPAQVSAIHSIGVHDQQVLVATDAGLFGSTDGGTSFALVDLPNAQGVLAESIESVVAIGGGGWVVSGTIACDVGQPAPGGLFGSDPDPQNCPDGNNTTIWRSADGTAWQQITSLPQSTGVGRTTLAAGRAVDPKKTVVYAWVGSNFGDHTVGFWRSTDGGQTWKDASGTVANPTLPIDHFDGNPPSPDCGDDNVGHGQAWYNQAIVVDPNNPDHVVVGGNLCGMRTLNGTADAPTWENVSHWLPGYGSATANADLPYVHADWHTAAAVTFNGGTRVFAGTDGGVFSSTDVFDDATTAEAVTWTHHNDGLATHLFYAVASGDPATANPFVLFGGLQDNGTRFRVDPADPSKFNQPVGGDGIGTAIHNSTSGVTYWASVEFGRLFCKPAEVDCSVENPLATTDAESHWHFVASPAGSADADEIDERIKARDKINHEDSEPFFIHYADVETDTTGQSVLTHSDGQVFVSVANGDSFTWQPISQDLTPASLGFASVTASRSIAGLYGAAGQFSKAPFFVTTQGNTMTTWKQAQPVHPLGDAQRMVGASSIDFPPVTPTGKQPGDVFIGAFTGTMIDPSTGARNPPPDDQGHLYRTTDGGQTWTSIVGSDATRRLPNVAVYVVKYDPVTPTTIYAGTDVGVYFSIDDGAHWDRMGDNFPMVPARDIYVARNQEFIRVATYGRGLWEIYPSAGANHGAPGNGDYDRNLKIDWIDVAAMSSRLGVTPATTTAPFYSWILDISGAGSDPPVQAIDDNDLTLQLAKLGGHP